MAYSQERVFWEVNDHGVNFDYVEPQRRARVIEVFDRLLRNGDRPRFS